VGKLLRLCAKYTIHWKTFAVHQAVAIMYCTRQVIQRENFWDRLKNRKSFPPRKFCRIRLSTWAYTCYKYSNNTLMHTRIRYSILLLTSPVRYWRACTKKALLVQGVYPKPWKPSDRHLSWRGAVNADEWRKPAPIHRPPMHQPGGIRINENNVVFQTLACVLV